MKELDLLKKDWQKNSNSFEQVSETEIYKMLHKKSSSVVKWILIISILEFVVLNVLGFFLPDDRSLQEGWFKLFLEFSTYLSYVITIVFIFLFYKNYKSISTTATTKKLMESILITRKTVRYYIFTNLGVGLLVGIITGFYLIQKSLLKDHVSMNFMLIEVLLLLVIVSIILGGIWLFYRILYGVLLKKLKRNYDELKKIDL
jgi:hypothetical protein